ncbi:hypothetical protein ACQP0C_03055 [Nocardia sp. CA-129566]
MRSGASGVALAHEADPAAPDAVWDDPAGDDFGDIVALVVR